MQIVSPSDEADDPVDDNDPASPEEHTFFRLQTTGEAQGRDNNTQKLLKWIVSTLRYIFFSSNRLFMANNPESNSYIYYLVDTSSFFSIYDCMSHFFTVCFLSFLFTFKGELNI